MTMNKIILSLIFVLMAVTAAAQGKMSGVFVDPGKTTEETRNGENKPSRTVMEGSRTYTADNWKADTAYYATIERRFDWYKGSGAKLSKTQASKAPRCYQLTMRNPMGNYMRIESLAYGKATPDSALRAYHYRPYSIIGRLSSRIATPSNTVWAARQDSICSVTLTPSPDGTRVLIETAADSAGNTVYSSFIERIHADQSVVTCIDGEGNVIDFNPVGNTKNGTLVIINYTPDGRVSRNLAVDGEGLIIYSALQEEGCL